jgi:MaoC dehydratase-like protein
VSATDVLDRVKARVGWQSEPVTEVIEAGHVRRFCEAIGDSNPRWKEEAPPTFLVALGSETPQIPEVLEYGKGWLNGGDRFEYLKPVRIGDTITARTTFTDAFEKQGGSGNLLFLIFDTEYRNQDGDTVARIRGTRIRR